MAEIGVGWMGLAGTEILLAAVPRACQPCLREVHTRAFLGQGSQHSYCLPSISLDVLGPGGGESSREERQTEGPIKGTRAQDPLLPLSALDFPRTELCRQEAQPMCVGRLEAEVRKGTGKGQSFTSVPYSLQQHDLVQPTEAAINREAESERL